MEQCWLNFVFTRGVGGNVVDNTEQLAGPKGNEYSDVNNYKRQDKAKSKGRSTI